MKQSLKNIYIVSIFIFSSILTAAQKTPDKIYGPLFVDVQEAGIFPDSKTFVDCTPKRNPGSIVKDYNVQKLKEGFSLQKFVEENFTLQKQPNVTNIVKGKSIEAHIKDLWKVLQRVQDKKIDGSSLLALPKPYIVPGGRFTEVYYWDSYFTMLGLKENGEIKTIENMVDNFAYLITNYGHIPNGNRTYYLSRSQPPFFGMMVELLAGIKGKEMYKKYLPALQKEYDFWMDGVNTTKPGNSYKRVVKLSDGTVLNRYCDDLDIPRQEGYKEDVKTAEEAVASKMMLVKFASEKAMNEFMDSEKKRVYKDLRSAAESGWDFSSRWFSDPNKLSSLHTTDFAPVDLNALLYKLETILITNGGKVNRKIYDQREKAIKTKMWNQEAGFYCDYNWVTGEISPCITAAGFFPLSLLYYTEKEKKKIASKIETITQKELLKPGGIVTTTNAVGQQWDAPNGWAPLQWMAVQGLEKIGLTAIAKDIAKRWVSLNKKVYEATGKLTEKYNVVDMTLETGGGEYPNLDGFGWTNGVYIALVKKYKWR
jgi:alpha,alpha-trehalase